MWEGLFRPMHLLVILALAILFFGPRRLPEFGKVLGDGLRGLRSIFQSKDAPLEERENEQGRSTVRRVRGFLRDSNDNDQKS